MSICIDALKKAFPGRTFVTDYKEYNKKISEKMADVLKDMKDYSLFLGKCPKFDRIESLDMAFFPPMYFSEYPSNVSVMLYFSVEGGRSDYFIPAIFYPGLKKPVLPASIETKSGYSAIFLPDFYTTEESNMDHRLNKDTEMFLPVFPQPWVNNRTCWANEYIGASPIHTFGHNYMIRDIIAKAFKRASPLFIEERENNSFEVDEIGFEYTDSPLIGGYGDILSSIIEKSLVPYIRNGSRYNLMTIRGKPRSGKMYLAHCIADLIINHDTPIQPKTKLVITNDDELAAFLALKEKPGCVIVRMQGVKYQHDNYVDLINTGGVFIVMLNSEDSNTSHIRKMTPLDCHHTFDIPSPLSLDSRYRITKMSIAQQTTRYDIDEIDLLSFLYAMPREITSGMIYDVVTEATKVGNRGAGTYLENGVAYYRDNTHANAGNPFVYQLHLALSKLNTENGWPNLDFE